MRTTRLPAAAVGGALVLAALAVLGGTAPATGAPSPDSRGDAVARAAAHLRAHPAAAARSAADAFVARDVVVDPDGSEHVRFARSHHGLPVVGGDLVVHGTRGGAFRGVSATQGAPLRLSTTPATSAAQAVLAAQRLASGAVDSVAAPVLAVTTRTAAPRLVWQVVVTGTAPDGGPSELRETLDAADLSLVEVVQGIETGKPGGGAAAGSSVAATGRTLYDGTVPLSASLSGTTYSLTDQTRGSATTSDLAGRTSGSGTLVTSSTSTFGNGSTSDPKTVAADAAYGVAQTWDYFKTVHGRNGIGDDGKGAPARVHYGRAYNNAFWSDSCFCMTFGDGDGTTFTPLVSLDVAGHEMTHGVTSRTAGLTYSGESGGLNEATSDIFGTMVEFQANSPQDVPDFTIGEKIGTTPLRYMAKPSQDGASKDCWYSGVGGLDVHYSSGPGNHVFYLLAQGSSGSPYGPSPVCGNAAGVTAVTGIGNAAAAAVWYRALRVYMTSSTDYHGARTAALQAATDLYGPSSSQRAAVADAFAGINVT